ncbi:MAG TPA: hypothetical protein VJ783_24920 [Pirellulales bacterium]|nr:hypothetical protein [Pirellulales bacterium]
MNQAIRNFTWIIAALFLVTGACAPAVPNRPVTTDPAAAKAPPFVTATTQPSGQGEAPQWTITWDVGASTTGQVFVSVDNGPEKLFAEDRRGVKPVKWKVKGRQEFRLYDGKDHQRRLASVVVDGPTGAPPEAK